MYSSEIVPCKYDSISLGLKNGMAKVELNGKWGYINSYGEEITHCIYDSIGDFSEGMAPILKEDKWGYINFNGEEIIPCIYDYVGKFSEGMAVILSPSPLTGKGTKRGRRQ